MSNENEITETVEIQEVNPDIVYQQDRAIIDTQIATAKTYPRNITKSINNAIAIVTMDKETAATCTYALPRGGKSITGPSVHLAKILAQVWGNMRAEAKVIDIGAKQITSQSVCFDLENNLAIKVEVKRSIMGRSGRFNDDMITMTGNASNSIALRNAILSVIPRAIVDKVYKAAIGCITGDLSDETKLIAKRSQVLTALKETYNVTEAEILQAVGKSAEKHITKEDIVTLIGIGTALKEGDISVDNAFRSKSGAVAQKSSEQHESERIMALIGNAKTIEELLTYAEHVKPEHKLLYDNKCIELKVKKEPKK